MKDKKESPVSATQDIKESPALANAKRAASHQRSQSAGGEETRVSRRSVSSTVLVNSPITPDTTLRHRSGEHSVLTLPARRSPASKSLHADKRNSGSSTPDSSDTFPKRNSGSNSAASRSNVESEWGIAISTYEPFFQQESRLLRQERKLAKRTKEISTVVLQPDVLQRPQQPSAQVRRNHSSESALNQSDSGSSGPETESEEEEEEEEEEEVELEEDENEADVLPSASAGCRNGKLKPQLDENDVETTDFTQRGFNKARHLVRKASRYRLDDLSFIRHPRNVVIDQAVLTQCEDSTVAVKESIASLTDDWVMLHRSYGKYGNLEKLADLEAIEPALRAKLNLMDSDVDARERSESQDQKDAHHRMRPGHMERNLFDSRDRIVTRADLAPFHDAVFAGAHAPPTQEHNARVISRASPYVDQEPDFALTLQDYQLEIADDLNGIEPFFLHFALFSVGDDGTMHKLSSDFSVVPRASHSLLFGDVAESMNLPTALFHLIQDDSFVNVFLVARVDRVFTGAEKDARLYAEGLSSKVQPKAKEQLQANLKAVLEASQACFAKGEAANYSTVPSFWGAFKVIDSNGHLVEQLRNPHSSNPVFAGPSAEPEKQAPKLNPLFMRSGQETKLQKISIDLYVTTAKTAAVESIGELLIGGKDGTKKCKLAARLNAGLITSSSTPPEFKTDPVRFVTTTNFQRGDPRPFTSFTNVMFLNSLQFPRKTSNGEHVLIKIELRHDDDPFSSEPDSRSFYDSEHSEAVFPEPFSNARLITASPTRPPSVKINTDLQSLCDERASVRQTCVSIAKGSAHFCSGEILIELPVNLSSKHHILFTFYAMQTKKGNRIFQTIGHSVLPLLEDGLLTKNRVHGLSVFLHKDKSGISSGGYLANRVASFQGSSKDVLNADKQFLVETRALSTIYPADVALGKFLRNVCSEKEKSVLSGLRSLESASSAECFRFLPVLLNMLFDQLVRSTCGVILKSAGKKPSKMVASQFSDASAKSSDDIPRAAFPALIKLLNRLDEPRSAHLLRSYATYMFGSRACHSSVHAPLVALWYRFISHSVMTGFKSQWFFCEIITKSIALAADKFGILQRSARHVLVPRRELQLIRSVVVSTVKQTQLLISSLETMVALPLMMCSLFSLGDRGEVFGMILEAIGQIPSNDLTTAMIKFKFWLRIIADHEQFTALSLPSLLDLNEDDAEAIFSAVDYLRSAQETRIKAETEKESAALLDAPTALDQDIKAIRAGQLEIDQALPDLIRKIFARRHLLPSVLVGEVTKCLDYNTPQRVREQAITVLRNHLFKFENDDRWTARLIREFGGIYFPFVVDVVSSFGVVQAIESVQELHKWLLCYLWVLKNTPCRILNAWFDASDLSHTSVFLATIAMCLDQLLDHGKSVEVNFIVLEVIMFFVKQFQSKLNGPQPHVFGEKIFQILHKLQSSKDVGFLTCLYACLASTIPLLHMPLFVHKQNGNLCLNLVAGVLVHCNSEEEGLRRSAAGLFYVLLEENFRLCQNTGRMDIQSTVAITKFVGAEKGRKCDLLTAQLRELVTRASTLDAVASGFGQLQPQFLTDLQDIVRHMIDITGYEQEINRNWIDGETVADLYIRIAHDFQKNPDMRCTWLENLAVVNMQNANIEEAAQCKLHIAYLVTEFLLQPARGRAVHPLPVELRAKNVLDTFATLCPNVAAEPPLLSDNAGANAETSFQGTQWTIDGLVTILLEADKLLQRANKFELSLAVLHVLSRIFTHTRNYSAMLEWTDKYQAVVKRLTDQQRMGQEVFSRYYRLQLFGPDKFLTKGEHRLHILKKPLKHTIGNITMELKKQLVHKLKLQEDQVVSVPNNVNGDALLELDAQEDKLYFQIVSVAPFFDESEREERQTAAEQQFNLKVFTSVVPFMVGGGKVDDASVERLAKRKTFFTTKRAFPYMNNRLPVAHVREETLNALECALEAMRDRVQQFRTEMRENPLRPNALQALLTGTLAAAVNVGPLRYCEVFIAADSPFAADYSVDQRMELRRSMAELIVVSGVALRLNANLIDKNQIPLQEMLAVKYDHLHKEFQEKYADREFLQPTNFDPIDSPHV